MSSSPIGPTLKGSSSSEASAKLKRILKNTSPVRRAGLIVRARRQLESPAIIPAKAGGFNAVLRELGRLTRIDRMFVSAAIDRDTKVEEEKPDPKIYLPLKEIPYFVRTAGDSYPRRIYPI